MFGKRFGFGLFLGMLGVVLPLFSSPAASGFKVSGAKLLDGNGKEFVMRGIAHPEAWVSGRAERSFPSIAATGANLVRVALSMGHQWAPTTVANLRKILTAAKDNNMVVMLELHDCTNFGDDPNAIELSKAVDHWLADSFKNEVVGKEDYVLMEIANEPFGHSISPEVYSKEVRSAISRMRAAGFRHTFIIDAPDYGQDTKNTMTDSARSLLASDPEANTMFAIHMYDHFAQEDSVKAYLKRFRDAGVPLVVGEFADSDGGDLVLPAEAVMRECHTYSIGYIAWSWYGNTSYLLDISERWTGSSFTPWGELVVNHPEYGIRKTSVRASVFPTGIRTRFDGSLVVRQKGATLAIRNAGVGNLLVEVFDLQGREVRKWDRTRTSGDETLSLEGLVEGAYVARVKVGGLEWTLGIHLEGR